MSVATESTSRAHTLMEGMNVDSKNVVCSSFKGMKLKANSNESLCKAFLDSFEGFYIFIPFIKKRPWASDLNLLLFSRVLRLHKLSLGCMSISESIDSFVGSCCICSYNFIFSVR